MTDGREQRRYVREVPLRRLGTPADIADVVAFVASHASRFITGERITVNGGHTRD
jgi:NAD(P)-dependent dehydrogenase (short-subunit alcohol dehydrogenase family)